MLTKAIIQSIDYAKNMCRVRIPLFETASRNVNMIEADAQFSIVPGVYNSYNAGDVVFIGFEENKMELPVIVGKLFVSAGAEAESYRGNLSGNSLSITDTAKLPYSTIFDYTSISQNSSLYSNLNTPKKLADSIINLRRGQTLRYQTVIEVLINGTNYKLYLKTADSYAYDQNSSNEPLYRLCTALKNSQVETIIPLDLATTETSIEVETYDSDAVELKTIQTTSYSTYQALIKVRELSAAALILEVFINGARYEVIQDARISRDDIKKVSSYTIYY